MKQVILFIILVLAGSGFSLNLTLTDANDGSVLLGYDANSEGKPPVCFGLKVTVDAGVISAVTPTFAGYGPGFGVFPGTITIDPNTGEIVNPGSPVALPYERGAAGTGIDTNSVILELGTIHDGNKPGLAGTLARITVSQRPCTLCVATDPIRGNIVMPGQTAIKDVNACIFLESSGSQECVKSTAPFYADWIQWGKPACWCYQRNCRGDIDGIKSGLYWVSATDLGLFRQAFNKLNLPSNGICADNNRTKSGPYWVCSLDLDIFRQYFNKPETNVPSCDIGYYNFWTN